MQVLIKIEERYLQLAKRLLLCIGAPALFLAAGIGYADITAPSFKAGDPLSASTMNAGFKTLTDAFNAQQATISALQGTVASLTTQLNAATNPNPDRPRGYTRNLGDGSAGIVSCMRGADAVVKVGTGQSAFWIDHYEASLWKTIDRRPAPRWATTTAMWGSPAFLTTASPARTRVPSTRSPSPGLRPHAS